MHPSTLPHPATPPVDEDLADQARPGYGIPSQDPRPGAQTALEPEDAEREAHSVLVGGGMMAGAATESAVVGASRQAATSEWIGLTEATTWGAENATPGRRQRAATEAARANWRCMAGFQFVM